MSDFSKRVITIVGALVVCVGGGLWVFWPRSLPGPDESRRARHPSGYSIVVPPSYAYSVNAADFRDYTDSITASDPGYQGFPPELAVRRFRGEPDWNRLSQRGFKLKGQFLGREAWIFNGPTEMGRRQLWNYRVVVKFEDRWFEIGVADPTFFEIDSSPWKAYLESFRLEQPQTRIDPSTLPVATQPTTRP